VNFFHEAFARGSPHKHAELLNVTYVPTFSQFSVTFKEGELRRRISFFRIIGREFQVLLSITYRVVNGAIQAEEKNQSTPCDVFHITYQYMLQRISEFTMIQLMQPVQLGNFPS
jgi:hypothetical protein